EAAGQGAGGERPRMSPEAFQNLSEEERAKLREQRRKEREQNGSQAQKGGGAASGASGATPEAGKKPTAPAQGANGAARTPSAAADGEPANANANLSGMPRGGGGL